MFYILLEMQNWYEKYEHKPFKLSLTYRYHEIMDNFTMAVDDRYLNPSQNVNKHVIEHNLTSIWNRFYRCYKKTFNNSRKRRLIVSLSGGVDSMSTCVILKHWSYNVNVEVVALHIQYNNRNESQYESDYLKHWCCKLGIKLFVYNITHIKRDDTKREDYERETREIRFNLYKTMMFGYDGGVILGHIRDDIFENIFRNISMNVNPFNITGMEKITNFDNFTILRPFLNINKNDIISFAEKFYVPYFCDTTPDWSMRGRFRNKLRPLLEDMYGKTICDKFIEFSTKIQEFKTWFDNEYYQTYIKSIKFEKDHVIVPLTYSDQQNRNIPKLRSMFWDLVIDYISKIKKVRKPSAKSLNVLYDKIDNFLINSNSFRVELTKNIYAIFEKDSKYFKLYFT